MGEHNFNIRNTLMKSGIRMLKSHTRHQRDYPDSRSFFGELEFYVFRNLLWHDKGTKGYVEKKTAKIIRDFYEQSSARLQKGKLCHQVIARIYTDSPSPLKRTNRTTRSAATNLTTHAPPDCKIAIQIRITRRHEPPAPTQSTKKTYQLPRIRINQPDVSC